MSEKRKEKFTPGPWEYDCEQITTSYKPKGERCHGYGCGNNFVADLNDGEYHEYYNEEEQRANGLLIAAAPEMYAGNEDAMITLDLMAQTGGFICAECPWGKKCKTCAMSEIFRLEIGLRKRIEAIQKKARGEAELEAAGK